MVQGTVINGVIVLDGGSHLPEGARVRIELADDSDDIAPEPAPYDREKELAILRESLADLKAGHGTPAREFLKQIAAKHNLPLAPGE